MVFRCRGFCLLGSCALGVQPHTRCSGPAAVEGTKAAVLRGQGGCSFLRRFLGAVNMKLRVVVVAGLVCLLARVASTPVPRATFVALALGLVACLFAGGLLCHIFMGRGRALRFNSLVARAVVATVSGVIFVGPRLLCVIGCWCVSSVLRVGRCSKLRCELSVYSFGFGWFVGGGTWLHFRSINHSTRHGQSVG